ncbi:hypothetical protein D9V41_04005 [Aeromicrobium phragmitis]|uniref:ABC transporter ATP-binding protein n=1 Tax=Aeromicrobium phragmitis TaxID=2478914 RepID=A0A3L8PQ29_9ACTN|nr:hypothetical protein D9V41_04005 [Aeromicrobium phragmitis]
MQIGSRVVRIRGSGGVRRRICTTREPTEHLDRDTADALMDDILALAPHRSVMVISHAPDVLARFDRVMTLGAEPVPVPAPATS